MIMIGINGHELILADELAISKIYYLRDQRVMMDSDLAELYGIGTKVLNQAVSRNVKRFPIDFMFQLNEDEWDNLRSQFVTANWSRRRTLPYVFTEHGILMLSSVLNSSRAIDVNIQLTRIFIRIRKMFIDTKDLNYQIEKIEKRLDSTDKNVEIVFSYLDELLSTSKSILPARKRIGFKPDDLV